MKVKLERTRMAMNGNHYSYEALVPTSEVDRNRFTFFILSDGKECVPFYDATRPHLLDFMPRGNERYGAFTNHVATANIRAWELMQSAFPELTNVPYQAGLVKLPEFTESHATVWIGV